MISPENKGSSAYQRNYYDSRLRKGINPYGEGSMQDELQELRKKLVREFSSSGTVLLDVASGLGESSIAGAEKLAKVISIDLSREALKLAPSHDGQILKVEGLAQCLPLADNSVDTACLWEILEHTDSPRSLLSEVYRVVRPNGIVLLSTPNSNCLNRQVKKKILRLLGRKEGGAELTARDDHYREYSYKETMNMMSEAGFEVENWYGYGLIFPPAWKLQHILLLSPLIKLHVHSGQIMKTLAQETYVVARCVK